MTLLPCPHCGAEVFLTGALVECANGDCLYSETVDALHNENVRLRHALALRADDCTLAETEPHAQLEPEASHKAQEDDSDRPKQP